MKTKLLFPFLLVTYSLSSYAAFSSVENVQLSDINNESQRKVVSVVTSLDEMQKKQIKDNPEKKELIISLRDSWDLTIKKRCDLESYESKGTDAEISVVNDCLEKNYTDELKYFSNMLP